MRRRYLCGALVAALATAAALSAAASQAAIHSTMKPARPSVMRVFKGGKPAKPTRTNNLIYQGGVGGIGVETAPKVYLVLWGSQWANNDPSGEAAILESFYGNVGDSQLLSSVKQYCQGVPSGTLSCNGAGTPAGGAVSFSSSTSVWADSSAAAPSSPSQSNLAAEAVRAAA